MSDHWLVIGGGQQAMASMKRLDPTRSIKAIITANAGYNLYHPDVYWISDPIALARYKGFWEKFEGEVISNDQSVHTWRGSLPTTRFPYIEKGVIFHGRCSGVLCCRVAISRGAKRLTLVGFQGYKATDVYEDVDGKPVAPRGDQAGKVNAAQAIAFANIAFKHPDVAVDVYGPTEIKFPESWRIV